MPSRYRYYQGNDVLVTREALIWRTGETGRTFVIAELRDVVIGVQRKWKWRSPNSPFPGPRRARVQSLLATYRNERVCLFTSSDERVFGQVARAVRRALEDGPPPGPRR